jgi:DNA-binding transcriptional MerR regulator
MAAETGKIYYSMGEVAEMMDVSPSLLRFWEKQFDILTPSKNKKGNRLFSADDVRLLKTIYHLVKERGMTLAGAARHLKAAGRGTVERDMEIAERLGSIRALLIEVRNELGGEGIVVEESNYERNEMSEVITEEAPAVLQSSAQEKATEVITQIELGSLDGVKNDESATRNEPQPEPEKAEPEPEPQPEPEKAEPEPEPQPKPQPQPQPTCLEQTLF